MPPPPGFATGHVRARNKDHLQLLSARRHQATLQALLAQSPPATWDSRALGWVGPIKNQGSCGSCWDFSGTCVVEVAYYKAGVLKPDGSDALSEQYTLDCGRNGGCGGDDNVTVLQWAKQTGLPKTADYGPYEGRGDRCKFQTAGTLHKIDDWGFADGQQGQNVTATELIKAAIMQYGCVGCGVDAGFNDPGTGVITGGGNNIDHDVALVGWNDTATKTTATVGAGNALSASVVASAGWWWMRNSWDYTWGDQGYARIAYGAWAIGTEAVWAHINASAPPIDWAV